MKCPAFVYIAQLNWEPEMKILFLEQSVIFQKQIPLFFANYLTQYMYINPYIISKCES